LILISSLQKRPKNNRQKADLSKQQNAKAAFLLFIGEKKRENGDEIQIYRDLERHDSAFT